jgi:hypothetical protein
MRILAPAAALAALLGSAAPALAATGQCYDAYGRPVGSPYNAYYPNRALIDWVIARGGTCTITGAPAYAPGAYAPYPSYQYGRGTGPGGSHADWCATNPPSGYCIVPERR